jgi:hypothetical protein
LKDEGGYEMYLLKTDSWYLERIIFLMAACMNSLSIILVLVHSIWWLILTGLVSVNLLVLALTASALQQLSFIRWASEVAWGGES